jgi:phage terminase large subunit GpA-like protein
MAGSQVGKTESLNNTMGYIIHHVPGPILFVEPTVELARAESKQRLSPMIAETPALRALVKEARSRDSGNTTLMKEFPGGILAITGANSAKGLSRMPARYLFLDEVDRYPGNVDEEGDPVSLAEKRTATFPRRKIMMTSTPTVKGVSRIEKEFLASDQRRYFVACPHCGHFDWIRWENIRWEEARPETAKLACVACERLIDERYKALMLAGGEWRPTAKSTGRTVGFHLSALYSPLGWKSWSECVSEFLEAKEDPFRLQAWVNTVLGETWEERGDSLDADSLVGRLESYVAEVPAGVGILVAAVDVQGDRLEAQVKGYGAGEESWLIAFHQVHGDPVHESTWLELDKFLTQEFVHESGRKVKVSCVTVDSGGHHTEEVYKFCRARLHRRVFAVRGGNEKGKPVVPKRPTTHNRYHAKLFTLCVDTAKDIILSRLRIRTKGPGYCHLPDWVDVEYLEQLTAEKAIWKWLRNRGRVREWIKLRERNEALDLEVYCLAALHILGQPVIRSLPERAARLTPEGQPTGEVAGEPHQARRMGRARRRGWVRGWES